ncbi:hypothetical protein [Pseudomonas chlororaphis]|uniref:hypothetical protein n=1 Tax=Pseudomonas chlororaphis TaxID=587753 RepID=UPI0015E04324|nr:hypothetical protein [Pseudomonas chlororaphis]QLL11748.1 hypothetical protein H0I86_22345 [Pseudomonas chlororaphis subsp. aurantiaca]
MPEEIKIQTWSGEGLPPVGTVCEWFERNCSRWAKCEVVFSSSWVMVIRDTSTHPDGPVDTAIDLVATAPDFRPIRTPEQIAAEERETAIYEMSVWAGVGVTGPGSDRERRILGLLWDAGYRKQVAP